jgi:hypothetical protein
MDMEIGSSPLTVELTFFVIGSDIKIIFRCAEIIRFDLIKEFDDLPFYLVLEVCVNQPKKVREPNLSDSEFSMLEHEEFAWDVVILPEAQLNIKCLKFDWWLEKATDEELSYRE